MKETEMINVEDAPEVEGLVFRKFAGEADFPGMLEILLGMREADGDESTYTLPDMKQYYANLSNCDVNEDMLMVELNGDMIGFSRCWWRQEESEDGTEYIYSFLANLLPEHRGQGIRKAMAKYMEQVLVRYINNHPAETPKSYQAFSSDFKVIMNENLKALGYETVRHFITMVRPIDAPLPEASMPEGLEVRPALPEHIDQIWKADQEAFQDHFGYTPATEEDKKRWMNGKNFNPDLWTIAWEGDEICGMIWNYVDADENKEFNRKRGYTEDISTRRPWRRRGLAKSLLLQSIQMFKEMGMEETALAVDTINPSGALKFYEDVGYRQTKRFSTWRKKIK